MDKSLMTWLEAAEYILSSEGPEMHIKDLTDRVMKLNMVNSSCKTSLETLLYRQTHKINSKFERVSGKMGWFKLKEPISGFITPILNTDDNPMPKSVVMKSCRNSDQSESSISSDSDTCCDGISYQKKYRYIKSLAKRLIMANVALADQLENINNDIDRVHAEKKYLIRKLLEVESTNNSSRKVTKTKLATPTSVPKSSGRVRKRTEPLPPPPLIKNESSAESANSSSEDDVKIKSSKSSVTNEGGLIRKKRIRKVQPVAMNENGIPVLPIRIGGLHVHNLGKIIWDRPAFHSERYIWPVGFESTRQYPSMSDPTKRCTYICRIADGGEAPIFEMASEETPDHPIQATSATACHHAVLKAINEARDKQATNAGSGPEFFGFSHPTIMNIIQDMEGADKCTKYKRTDFIVATSRGKQTGKIKKQAISNRSKTFYKMSKTATNDRSLAPVVTNTQLTSIHRDTSSSDCTLSDNSTHDLVIDAMIS